RDFHVTGVQTCALPISGAFRIDSNDNASVRNVAWINPDGSKALVAYNDTTSAQTLRVNWGGESFAYSVPAHTAATFTWSGTQSRSEERRVGKEGRAGGE